MWNTNLLPKKRFSLWLLSFFFFQFWDDELEATACEHVKYCQFDHDQCRATPSYDHPGQNLRKSSDYVETVPDYNKIIEETVDDWFGEYSSVSSNIVDKYFSRHGSCSYGHFTVMSREVNDRVGCCMMQYLHNERNYWWRNTFVTCNYRETNYIGEPIYYRGPAASQCNTWGDQYQRSSRYNGLCTDNYYGGQRASNSYDPYVAASSVKYEAKAQLVTSPPKPKPTITTRTPAAYRAPVTFAPVTFAPVASTNFSSYCQLEQRKCRGKRHIGCEKNEKYFTVSNAFF